MSGAVQLVSIFNDHIVNELRGQVAYRGQIQDRFSASGAGPVITVSGIANFGGPSAAGFVYQETTPEIADNFSYIRGAHSLKFGVSTHAIRDTQVQATFAQYNFPDHRGVPGGGQRIGANGLFELQPDRGQSLAQLQFAVHQLLRAGFLEAAAQSDGDLRPALRPLPDAVGGQDFAVRVLAELPHRQEQLRTASGLRVGLGKDQKTVIRASSGIFYDAPQTDQYRRAISLNGNPAFFTLSATPNSSFAPSFPNVFTAPPAGRDRKHGHHHHLAGFRQPLFHQCELLGDPRIDGHFGADRFLSLHGGQAPARLPQHQRGAGRDFLADGRPIFGTARYYAGFGNITSAESVGTSNYNGLNVTLRKQLARGYELFATYTWSHAIDDAPEQNNIDAGVEPAQRPHQPPPRPRPIP